METRIKLTGPADASPTAATLNIAPTWAGIMPALVAALQDGTGDGPRIARAELSRLAGEVDSLNARQRAERAAMPPAAELARLIRESTPDALGRALADIGLGRLNPAEAIRENLPGKAAPVPPGEASHLKTATAALAGVLAGYAEENARTAREGVGGFAWRAVFHARAGAFYHAASDAAARGGNNGAELKRLGAEETDKATDARTAAVRELADVESRAARGEAIRAALAALGSGNPGTAAEILAAAVPDDSAEILARFHPVT